MSAGITAEIAQRSSAAYPIQYLGVGVKMRHTIFCQFDQCSGSLDLVFRLVLIKKLEQRWNCGNNRAGKFGCRVPSDHTVRSTCSAPFSDNLASTDAAPARVSSFECARSSTSNGIATLISTRSSTVHYRYFLDESISYDSPISANLASRDAVAA
jgi:hypothetical protein